VLYLPRSTIHNREDSSQHIHPLPRINQNDVKTQRALLTSPTPTNPNSTIFYRSKYNSSHRQHHQSLIWIPYEISPTLPKLISPTYPPKDIRHQNISEVNSNDPTTPWIPHTLAHGNNQNAPRLSQHHIDPPHPFSPRYRGYLSIKTKIDHQGYTAGSGTPTFPISIQPHTTNNTTHHTTLQTSSSLPHPETPQSRKIFGRKKDGTAQSPIDRVLLENGKGES